MRDHVTEELISAYADGELEGDELKFVEDLLAKSPEHLQLLAEFQALRASMWSLPSFKLPADFHTRVVGQIDELETAPSKEEVQPASRSSRAGRWRNAILTAASLAALVAFAVMLRPSAPSPSVAESVVNSAAFSLVTLPVYFQKAPEYITIYDVTVTPEGQENEVVVTLLQNLGINIDSALRLDEQLEKELMIIREPQQLAGEVEATDYASDPATPKSTEEDSVEMIYVAGKFDALDQFGMDLIVKKRAGKEVSEIFYGMAPVPNKIGVMHRLHDSARQYLADANIVPSDAGHGFRLSFSVELTSVSVPGAATFPMPTIVTEGQGGGDMETSHILLIIRKVGDNAN